MDYTILNNKTILTTSDYSLIIRSKTNNMSTGKVWDTFSISPTTTNPKSTPKSTKPTIKPTKPTAEPTKPTAEPTKELPNAVLTFTSISNEPTTLGIQKNSEIGQDKYEFFNKKTEEIITQLYFNEGLFPVDTKCCSLTVTSSTHPAKIGDVDKTPLYRKYVSTYTDTKIHPSISYAGALKAIDWNTDQIKKIFNEIVKNNKGLPYTMHSFEKGIAYKNTTTDSYRFYSYETKTIEHCRESKVFSYEEGRRLKFPWILPVDSTVIGKYNDSQLTLKDVTNNTIRAQIGNSEKTLYINTYLKDSIVALPAKTAPTKAQIESDIDVHDITFALFTSFGLIFETEGNMMIYNRLNDSIIPAGSYYIYSKERKHNTDLTTMFAKILNEQNTFAYDGKTELTTTSFEDETWTYEDGTQVNVCDLIPLSKDNEAELIKTAKELSDTEIKLTDIIKAPNPTVVSKKHGVQKIHKVTQEELSYYDIVPVDTIVGFDFTTPGIFDTISRDVKSHDYFYSATRVFHVENEPYTLKTIPTADVSGTFLKAIEYINAINKDVPPAERILPHSVFNTEEHGLIISVTIGSRRYAIKPSNTSSTKLQDRYSIITQPKLSKPKTKSNPSKSKPKKFNISK